MAHPNMTRWGVHRCPILCNSPETPGVCISGGNRCCCTTPVPCANGSPDLLEEGRAGDAEAGDGGAVCRVFANGGMPEEPACCRPVGGDAWEPLGEGWPWRVAREGNASSRAPPKQPAPVLKQGDPPPKNPVPTGVAVQETGFACAPAIGAQWGHSGQLALPASLTGTCAPIHCFCTHFCKNHKEEGQNPPAHVSNSLCPCQHFKSN